MTPYENPLAINGLPGRWPALPRTRTEELRRGPGIRPHLTARLVLAAVLETAVLLGTVQVLAGIGHEAQAGWAPTPGGVAPAAPRPLQAPLVPASLIDCVEG
jgi:hypothetical protein